MKNLNEVIKNRRVSLQQDESTVAKKCGLTVYEYGDIENYPDEIKTVTHLADLRKLSKTLNLSLFDLFDIECEKNIDQNTVKRNELIKQKRLELGLSKDKLADNLGFYEQAVIDMEKDELFLENWSFELIEQLSKELNIPINLLLAV